MVVGKKTGFIHELKRNKIAYLMFLPVGLYFFIFQYLPMPGIVVAFKDYNFGDGIFKSPWNGLINFRFFLESGKAWLVTRNTFLYNLTFLLAYVVFSLIIAILISELSGQYFKKISQTIIFLPYFISWVTVAAFIYNIFGYEYGFLNGFLRQIGMQPMDIYSNVSYWFLLLPLLYVWKWIGFGSVLYLSAIMGIDQECFESAKIDGANEFQKLWHITLPLLKPTVVVLILLGIGRIMRGEFDMFYQLVGTNSMLFDNTDIIDTFVFRSLISNHDFGMAGVAGLYQSVLCFLIISGVNLIVKRYHKDYALF